MLKEYTRNRISLRAEHHRGLFYFYSGKPFLSADDIERKCDASPLYFCI